MSQQLLILWEIEENKSSSQSIQRSNTQKNESKSNDEYNLNSFENNKIHQRPETASCILREGIRERNRHTFHISEGSINANHNRSSNTTKICKRRALSKIVKNQKVSVQNIKTFTHQLNTGLQQNTAFAFKDMNIQELNKHKRGLLNVYSHNTRKPTGLKLYFLFSFRFNTRRIWKYFWL